MTGYRKYDLSGALVTQADYFYDVLGRRMAKQVNGVVTRYVYFEEDIILQIDPATNDVAVTYYHGPGIDEPLVAVAPREGAFLPPPSYYITNGLGTVTDILANTSPIYSITSDSFGRIVSTSGTGALGPYRYTGREYHPESGLMYYRAPYYDPWAGRFVSEDPLGVGAGDENVYRYVFNDPGNLTDPYGLWPSKIHHEMIRQAFGGLLGEDEIEILEAASHDVDWWMQDPAHDPLHYTREPGLDDRTARERYIAAVCDLFARGQHWAHHGLLRPEALYYLGLGMHALMDSTTPQHQGLPVWGGLRWADRHEIRRHRRAENVSGKRILVEQAEQEERLVGN